MNNKNTIDLENWINEVIEGTFSQEEGVLASYLFSESKKILSIKNPSIEIYKSIAAASIVLSTKLLGDGEYFTIYKMEYTCPPYPPFLDSISIIQAEKMILEIFDYNLVNVTNKCFNINNRFNVQKQILEKCMI